MDHRERTARETSQESAPERGRWEVPGWRSLERWEDDGGRPLPSDRPQSLQQMDAYTRLTDDSGMASETQGLFESHRESGANR